MSSRRLVLIDTPKCSECMTDNSPDTIGAVFQKLEGKRYVEDLKGFRGWYRYEHAEDTPCYTELIVYKKPVVPVVPGRILKHLKGLYAFYRILSYRHL